MTQNASIEMKEGDLKGYAKIDINHIIMYSKNKKNKVSYDSKRFHGNEGRRS